MNPHLLRLETICRIRIENELVSLILISKVKDPDPGFEGNWKKDALDLKLYI